MEKENAPLPISDEEFLHLVRLSKDGDPEAMLRLLQVFEDDILKISRYIRMSREDAVQSIVTDFIALVKQSDDVPPSCGAESDKT
ncbi:helix-turn-helix domain-containing protein [Paenibacillus sp. GbtcB18]|uniref:helix-turn-helix domain-containing protein n=2 Tax=Paenibacillus TaxID=44249 RepID=UPI001C30467A|nr:helix-turn-helix domain-containing protein [Paenibacillus sp. GbtcB18]